MQEDLLDSSLAGLFSFLTLVLQFSMSYFSPVTSVGKIVLKEIGKKFQDKHVLHNVEFTCSAGEVWAITGHNGAGKSTLLQIISSALSPDKGNITYFLNNSVVEKEAIRPLLGFVAPYLAVYEEFSPYELLQISARLRGVQYQASRADYLLEALHIAEAANRPVSTFSSGMKQRVKYVLALFHSPTFLCLDEPMTNLDEEGIQCVTQIITSAQQQNLVVLIATNEQRDIALCSHSYSVV